MLVLNSVAKGATDSLCIKGDIKAISDTLVPFATLRVSLVSSRNMTDTLDLDEAFIGRGTYLKGLL